SSDLKVVWPASFLCHGNILVTTTICKSVANLSPSFGAESAVFVRLSAPSLEGDPIFPSDQIGLADRGLTTWLPRRRRTEEYVRECQSQADCHLSGSRRAGGNSGNE